MIKQKTAVSFDPKKTRNLQGQQRLGYFVRLIGRCELATPREGISRKKVRRKSIAVRYDNKYNYIFLLSALPDDVGDHDVPLAPSLVRWRKHSF